MMTGIFHGALMNEPERAFQTEAESGLVFRRTGGDSIRRDAEGRTGASGPRPVGRGGRLREEASRLKPATSAQQAPASQGLSSVQVHAVADPIVANIPGVKLSVVDTPNQLPFKAPSDARGAYFKGTAYLAASNLDGQGSYRGRLSLWHENLVSYC